MFCESEYLTRPFAWSLGFIARLKKIALIAGILVGISPSPLQGAAERAGNIEGAVKFSADALKGASDILVFPDVARKHDFRADRAAQFLHSPEITFQAQKCDASAMGV